MIIIYDDHYSFQRCGYKDGSGEYNFSSLDELYAAEQVDAIYKGNDIDLLCRVIDKCGIVNVNTFQMDHLEYFEDDDIHTLLYEKDEDGYAFPWYVETFYFDDTEKWLIYVSHEGTISFTGSKIVEIADKVFGGKYEIR